MKVFNFIILLFLLSCPKGFAQKWVVTHEPADELRGVGASTNHYYQTADGSVLIYGYDSGVKQLGVSAKTVFDYDSDNEVGITVGFYDLQNSLIDRGSQLTRVTQSGTIVYFKGDLKDKIIDFIMNKEGYVRFFGHLYANGAFDLKVPCMKNRQNTPKVNNRNRVSTSKNKTSTLKRK